MNFKTERQDIHKGKRGLEIDRETTHNGKRNV